MLLQLFVGGIDMNINEEHLRQVFSTYGELVSVKIPAGKKCAFVQFANRSVNCLAYIFSTHLWPCAS